MRLIRIRKFQLCLVALMLSGAFADDASGESFSGSAADAIMETQAVKPAATRRAAPPRPAKAGRPPAAKKPGSVSKTTSVGGSSSVSATSNLKGRSARAGNGAGQASGTAGKNAIEKSSWTADGAINLDAIKNMEGIPGLLLIGGPSLDLGGADVIASGVSQAGLGTAVGWGVGGVVICLVANLLLNAMQPKNAGARPGSAPSNSGVNVVALLGAFIAVFCVKLFGFPDHPVILESKNGLELTPVYSNEFGLHCLLPKDILKAKMKEKVGTTEIAVTVAGYRRGKNEMMIGYAHMPSFDEMVKAKQAMEGPKFANIANFQNLNVGFSKPQYYFDVNKALDGCVDAAGKRANFKVGYRCPITVQGKLPGREYEGNASHGRLVRGRVFIGYNNYYHAIVVGDPSFVNSNDGYKFLNSMDVH